MRPRRGSSPPGPADGLLKTFLPAGSIPEMALLGAAQEWLRALDAEALATCGSTRRRRRDRRAGRRESPGGG